MLGTLTFTARNAVGLMFSFLGMGASFCGLYADAVSATWLSSLNVYINQSVLAVTGIGCFFAAASIAVSNIKSFSKQHLVIKTNTADIQAIRDEFAAEKQETERRAADLKRELDLSKQEAAEAKEKAARAHEVAHQIARESKEKIAKAKEESDRRVTELEEKLKQVRHDTRDVANALVVEREVREQTQATLGSSSGIHKVMVISDPEHPVLVKPITTEVEVDPSHSPDQ